MNELIQSTILWAGLAVVVAFAVWVIDRLLRGMFNRVAEEEAHYPHRVANELPRCLHKGDHDEAVELTDDVELSAK